MMKTAITAAALLMFASGAAHAADKLLWVVDSYDNVGYVDLTTKTATKVGYNGIFFGDIGFTSDGTLYGVNYPGAPSLYKINLSNGAATDLGALTGIAVGAVDGVVGNGSNLILSYFGKDSAVTIDPNNLAAGGTVYGSGNGSSAGDLAFYQGSLLDLEQSGDSQFIYNITTQSAIGRNSYSDAFGLASDGSTLYMSSGTKIYTVNPTTGALTFYYDYYQSGLGPANGLAMEGEGATAGLTPPPSGVPEPSTWTIMAGGIGLLGLSLRRRKSVAAVSIPTT